MSESGHRTAARATILIRIMVGAVFLSEGIQKFLFPQLVGSGRFSEIGLPFPEIFGPFVGGVEILSGAAVLAGAFTRYAVIPLFAIMGVAFWTTKWPILLDSGFWSMTHAARTDFCMTLGAVYLFLAGSGPWSIDARMKG